MSATIDQPHRVFAESQAPPVEGRELVVLIHGIASLRWYLWPLAKRLERRGYATRLWTYFTIRGSIRQHGERFAAELRRLDKRLRPSRIHVVAHSMGSIVTRCALAAELPDCFGRVVMIGPPNQGAPLATRLTPLYRYVSTTVPELQDTADSFVNQLPPAPPEREIGVLAADNDHLVPLASTHLTGQADHLVVPGWHMSALWKAETARQTAAFLATGKFKKEPRMDADKRG